MRIRPLVLAVGVIALVASGCTVSDPEPSPSPTACGPDDARVRWGQLADSEPAPVGYRRVAVEAGQVDVGKVIRLDYASTVDADEGRFEQSEWVEFLLDDLNRTGQSTTVLGVAPSDFGANGATPQVDGDYIVGYRAQQVSATFSIECGFVTEGEGSVTTTTGSLDVTLVGCDEPPVSDEQYPLDLQQYC